MAQQENGAKEAEQRRKPSDCVNNRSGHLASQRRVRSRAPPLVRNHEDEVVPDGQITKNSSTPIAKNIPLSPSGKSVLSARAIPFRKEGVGHRHELTGCGGRDGVGRETRSQGDFS